MATEIDIPVSVSSKKGESEDDAFSSEFSEQKVTEHPGNKVNQPLETSSHVAETVNTQLESDKRTDEGGIFFQALSVPVVTVDEHINTPESCEITTTEDQEDKWAAKNETATEGEPKTNDDEQVAVIASKETEDHGVVDANSAQTKGSIDHVLGLIKGQDKDIEEVTEFSNKDESIGGSSNAKTEAGKEEDLQGKNYNDEGNEPEIVKTKEKVEEGTTENEKDDHGQMKKSGRPLVKEESEETDSQKAESEKLEVLDSVAPSKKEIASEDEDLEKERALNMLENDQGNGDDVTSSQDATSEDIKETTTSQHETTVAYFKEQDLNERPTEILEEKTDGKSVDVQEASEHEEQTEVIRPIVKIHEKMEQKALEKVESEKEAKLSDSSSMKLEEKAITTLTGDDQEKEQEVNISEKSQGEDNITSSFEGGLQKKNHNSESSEPEVVETKEIIKEDTREIEYNVVPTDVCISTQTEPEEKTPKNEEKNEEEVIGSEEVSSKKVESEEVSNLPDNSSMVPNENAIVSKEDQDKLHVLEKGQGSGDVTSSQNASSEYIKETTTGQHATSAYFEEGQELNVMPKDILKEGDDKTIDPQEESEQCENEAKDKREEKQEESVNKTVHSGLEIEQKDDTEEIKPSDEKQEQTADASNSTQTKSHVESAEHEENNEGETIESDDGQTKKLTTQSKPEEEATEENEEKNEDAIECDDGQTKKSISPMVEVYKETVPEKANEYEEGLIHSDSSSTVLNENEIVSKDEYQEKGQEFYVSEKGQHGGDDVTSSQNESSEDIKEMIGEHDTKVAYFEEVQDQNAVAKDILKEDATVPQEANEQYENGAHDKREQKLDESIHPCLEIEQEECAKEIKSSVETELKEEQERPMHISTQTETQIESQLKATEHEEKNEDQENKQEVGTLEENQGEEEVTCSGEASSKKDSEGNNYDDEHIELKLVENRESIKEDIEVIRTNVETEEIKEQQGSLSAIVTDVCMSAQTESKEDTTKSEESIESYKGCEETSLNFIESIEEVQIFYSSTMKQNEQAIATIKDDQDKDQEVNMPAKSQSQGNDNVTSSQDAAFEEDFHEKDCHNGDDESEFVKTRQTIEKDIEEIELNENEVANKDEDQEKEQELNMSEEVQGGGDDVISSQNSQNENTKETTTNQESQCEINKEIEAKLDAENQANGREDEVVLTEKMSSELGQPMEKNVEEIQACQTTTMGEKTEEEIAAKNEDLSLGSIEDTNDITIKEEKSFLDGRTRKIEISALEHEPIGEKTTMEPEKITKQDFEESQNEPNKELEPKLDVENQADRREDRSETKDEAVLTEKMSSELGQPTEPNVEEIQACRTTTMSEKTEDEIAEKDEDLSLRSKKDIDGDTVKEEQSFLDGRTREIETSTLENEPVGEKTTIDPEEITKQDFQESQTETNKEMKGKLYAENQADEREDTDEMKDEMSSELRQPVEQNVEEIQACQTTPENKDDTIDDESKSTERISQDAKETEDEKSNKKEDRCMDLETDMQKGDINKKVDEDDFNATLEQKSIDASKQEKNDFGELQAGIEKELQEHLRGHQLEESNSENPCATEQDLLEDVGEKTTAKPEENTKQAYQEIQTEANKEKEEKLDIENQVDEREERKDMKNEVVSTEKMLSSKLGQPMEQNVEEIQAFQTTTMNAKTEEEIVEKDENLSLGSIENTNDNIVKEETNLLGGKTKEIEISTLEHEHVAENTAMKPEEITKQAFQESQTETNKEQEAKLDVENQANNGSAMKDEVSMTKEMSSELGQLEQNVEIQECQTTTMSEKIEDEIAEKNENLSLSNKEDTNDDTIKEEKSFLDGRTREIEIYALDMEPEKITKQDFEESQSETNKELEPKLDAKNQADEREDRSEMKDEVIVTEKELRQPMEQNVEEIQECRTTTKSERIEDEIAEKDEVLSLGSIKDTDDDTIKEEKSFLDGRTREIETSTLENELVGEKTTLKPEEVTKIDFQESKTETNKEIEGKLDVENQVGRREDKNETKDEVIVTEKISSELEQPMEQHVEEIQACQTTTMSEKMEEITEKDVDLSVSSKEDTNDDTIKEEKSFLDGRTREIEIYALDMEPEKITKQDFEESQSETNKELIPKLDVEYQADEREDRNEMKDEVIVTEKELGQPMEQNVEEIQECQTTTMSERIEDEIAEKDEVLSLGSIKDTDDDTIKEEKSFLDGRTREIETSTLENELVGEKTTLKPEEVTKIDFQENQTETNKEIEGKLDVENQVGGREDKNETKDEVIVTEKISSELEQPMEQHVEEIQACQTTTMSEKMEEITEKDIDLSLGSIEDTNDNTVQKEKSFLDGRTEEIEISALENEPFREKTTTKSEEIKQAYQESQTETDKEIEGKLDAENQVDGREDRSDKKDEVIVTEKMTFELGQPMEQNVEEIQACQTTTMGEKTEDEIAEKNEDLSLGSIENTNDNIVKEEKSFLDGRTREIEISALENEPVEENTNTKSEEIKQAYHESQTKTNKEIEGKLDVENQVDGREDRSDKNDEVIVIEKVSSELGQPMEQNVEEIQAYQTTSMSEKTEEDIAEKDEDFSHGSIEDTNDNTTKEEEIFLDRRTREIEISTLEHEHVEEKNGGLDEVSKKEYIDLNEATSAELQEDFIPSGSPENSTEDTPNSQNSISENLPKEDLDSVSEVQIPRAVPKSEDSNLKEECLISATATSVDEEVETVTKEISNDEIAYSDPIPVENPEVTEVIVDAQIGQEDLQAAEDINCESKTSSSIQALYTDIKEGAEKSARISGEVNNGVDEASKQERIPTLKDSAQLEPQVDQSNIESIYPSENDKSSTQALDVVADSEESKVKEEHIVLATAEFTDENNGEEEQEIKTNEISSAENLEPYGELKPTSELMIDEDQVDGTKPQPEQSDITSEKEGETEVKEQDSEEDNCLKELKKISKSNQKELANEIEDSELIQPENTEVAEIKTESQRELKNIPEGAPNHEFEISEIQTPEAILEMEMKEEHLEAIKDSCETITGGLSSEKIQVDKSTHKDFIATDSVSIGELLGELKEIDAKEDTGIIVRGAEKAAEHSYQDAVAEVTEISQKEEKLVSTVPHEELTSEDQTNELATETNNTKVDKDRKPEEFTKTLSEEERSVEENHIEEEGQGNFGVEDKEGKGENEAVEDVLVNEVLLEVQKAKESKSIKDNINEEVSCVPNQLTSATDEVCQIKRLNSSPNELLEAKDSVEDIGEPKLMTENLNLKAEKMIEADANKGKETLDEPQADDPAKTTSDSISSSTEQDKETRSEESTGHGDIHKLEDKPTEVCELTSEVDETVAEDKEVSTMLTENIPEASHELLLVKHDPETTTIQGVDKRLEEAPAIDEQKHENDLDYTAVDETIAEDKEVSKMLTENLLKASPEMRQVKHDPEATTIQGVDKRFGEAPAVDDQKHENDLDYTAVDETVIEGKEVSKMLTENLPEASPEMLLVKHDPETTTIDTTFEEAPAVDDQKHENDHDYTAKARNVDVVSESESREIEQQHLDTKEATVGPINQENQSEQKKEADENTQNDIPIEKVPKQTTAHEEIADEILVMPVIKEEEKSNYLQDYSKEEEHSGRTYQDPEAVTEPSQTDKLSDKVKKVEPIDIQVETMAEGNLHEEKTEKRTNITEAAVNLHHKEKGDETSTEAAIPVEYVKSSNVDLKGDMDAPVPKCVSTGNPEVRSAILEVLSGMDATAAKADYNKDPNDKTAESHVAEKEVLKEDIHHEPTCKGSETTEKVFGTNQEPNLPITKERSMEFDAPVMPGTAATENVEISQKYVPDDLIKPSQFHPELQKKEVSACDVDKKLPDKPYQNESMESKLLTGNIDASHVPGEPTANSLDTNAKDLKPSIALSTEPQCSSEVVKEEKKISDEKEKSETPEPATIVFTDILHESTQGNSEMAENSEVAENLIKERGPAPTKDQQVDKKETGDNGAKTDEEDEAEEDDEDNEKMGPGSDAAVMVEASKDMEVKVHKKSHNILSGVGSKVKHSIAKVKKAITGKSSHPKPPSPKEREIK